MKALGRVDLDKNGLQIAFWKHIFRPRDLLMQPVGTILIIVLDSHLISIPIKIYYIGPSCLGGDVVLIYFLYNSINL